jgi:hypothetical protein
VYDFSTRNRTSRSRSPNIWQPHRAFRSPSPSISLPPSSSPTSVLLDISRNQREILRQNRDLHDRLAIVEVRHVDQVRETTRPSNDVGFASRGRAKQAKRRVVRRHVVREAPGSGEENDVDAEIAGAEEKENLRLKKKELSTKGQKARKILQVSVPFRSTLDNR